MKHINRWPCDINLVSIVKNISTGVLYAIEIKNSYYVRIKISKTLYQDLYTELHEKIFNIFYADIFQYGYDSFFVVVKSFKVVDMRGVKQYVCDKYKVFVMLIGGYCEFNLCNDIEVTDIVYSAIEQQNNV